MSNITRFIAFTEQATHPVQFGHNICLLNDQELMDEIDHLLKDGHVNDLTACRMREQESVWYITYWQVNGEDKTVYDATFERVCAKMLLELGLD